MPVGAGAGRSLDAPGRHPVSQHHARVDRRDCEQNPRSIRYRKNHVLTRTPPKLMSAVLDRRTALLPGRFEFLMGLYAENYHRLTHLFAPQQLELGSYVSDVDDGLPV